MTPMNMVHGIEGGLLRSGRGLAGGCVSPAGVSAPNTNGMPPVVLKKLVNALATFCWLTLSPPDGVEKLSARFR